MQDRIILRRVRTSKAINKAKDEFIAFILGAPANKGNILSYQIIGQHGDASLEFYRRDTVPATPEECAPLVRDLKAVGYDPLFVKRRS